MMTEYFCRLVAATKEPVKPAPAPGADILKLLTKAQTDFVTVRSLIIWLFPLDPLRGDNLI